MTEKYTEHASDYKDIEEQELQAPSEIGTVGKNQSLKIDEDNWNKSNIKYNK